MASGRLTFLYPHLLRATAAARGSAGPASSSSASASASATCTWSGPVEVGGSAVRGWGRRRSKSSFARHGKAVEPIEWEKQKQQQQQQQQQEQSQESQESQESPASNTTPDAKTPDAPAKPEIGKLYFQDAEKKTAQEAPAPKDAAPESEAASTPKQEEPKTGQDEMKLREQPTNAEPNASPSPSTPIKQAESNEAAGSAASNKPNEGAADDRSRQPKDGGGVKPGDVLETVFHMGPPENVAQEQQQTPSYSRPKYVHHFDSYSLVKQLQEGGYSQDQAITMMKAIRGILAHHLDMAQERLVSKSDVENESYLFSAACSELSAEIKNNRRISDEQMRQQRTHLQHEADILTQTLNQELLTLNDNVQGLFNDRKMAVREEQKALESAIQQISYKMSIMLSSDSKSEIEGVRWILIRRSVLGIIFMAMLTLGTIRYATYVSHERQREADRKKKEEEDLRRDGGKSDRSSAPDAAAILTAN